MYKVRPFANLQIMCGAMLVSHIKAIQILQNRLVYLITYDQYPLIPSPLPSSNPIFCKLELLKIREILIFMVCLLMLE